MQNSRKCISWENVSLGKGTQENCKKYMALWDEWFFKTMVMSGCDWQWCHSYPNIHMVSKEWLLQQHSYPASLSQWQSDRMSSLHCVTLTVALCQCVTLVELYSVTLQYSNTEELLSSVTVVAQKSQTDAWLPHPTSAWRVPDTRPDPIIFGNTQSVPDFFPESSGILGIGYSTFFGRMCL